MHCHQLLAPLPSVLIKVTNDLWMEKSNEKLFNFILISWLHVAFTIPFFFIFSPGAPLRGCLWLFWQDYPFPHPCLRKPFLRECLISDLCSSDSMLSWCQWPHFYPNSPRCLPISDLTPEHQKQPPYFHSNDLHRSLSPIQSFSNLFLLHSTIISLCHLHGCLNQSWEHQPWLILPQSPYPTLKSCQFLFLKFPKRLPIGTWGQTAIISGLNYYKTLQTVLLTSSVAPTSNPLFLSSFLSFLFFLVDELQDV